MSKANGEQELSGFDPTNFGCENGTDKVADDGEMRGRIGHFAETAFATGKPLAVDFEF